MPPREQLAVIAGQKPQIRRARKSIANFKLREGMPVGVKVTLRGERMYEMLDRLQSIAIPRIRDFRGLNPRSFDGRGNYSLGIREQIIFPEIDYDCDRPGARARRDDHDDAPPPTRRGSSSCGCSACRSGTDDGAQQPEPQAREPEAPEPEPEAEAAAGRREHRERPSPKARRRGSPPKRAAAEEPGRRPRPEHAADAGQPSRGRLRA